MIIWRHCGGLEGVLRRNGREGRRRWKPVCLQNCRVVVLGVEDNSDVDVEAGESCIYCGWWGHSYRSTLATPCSSSLASSEFMKVNRRFCIN